MIRLAIIFCFGLSQTLLSAGTIGDCVAQLNGSIVRFGEGSSSSPIQDMANSLLDYVASDGRDVFQVAVPINLEVNPQQSEEFGDGQRNALATYGELRRAPFTAVLRRPESSKGAPSLTIVFSNEMPGFDHIGGVEFFMNGESRNCSLTGVGSVEIPVDIERLHWDKMWGATPLFFRPVGWEDWFAVQFPYPYLKTTELLEGMHPSVRTLPSGQSVVDPLGLSGSTDVQNALRNIPDSEALGFQLARADRVHGVYQRPDGSLVLTSNGGIWTRYRLGTPFKVVYLVKDPRDLEAEGRDGVVSGTGPHYIGATAEIILNSLGNESLMTFYGISAPGSGPDGAKLAWRLTHQWVGTWLRPGEAFVTPQGSYHWHLNHLGLPVAAQVLTPPEVPSGQNFLGFPKQLN